MCRPFCGGPVYDQQIFWSSLLNLNTTYKLDFFYNFYLHYAFTSEKFYY